MAETVGFGFGSARILGFGLGFGFCAGFAAGVVAVPETGDDTIGCGAALGGV